MFVALLVATSGSRIAAVAAVAADITLNLGSVGQTIDGFGASDAWSDNSGLPVFTDAEMDLFFSQQNGIGLSLLRLAIETNGSTSTSLSIAQRAAARGARVWATPWSAPGSWKDNASTAYGGHLCAAAGQGACVASRYTDWAARLANVASTLKNNGVDLYALSVQNEPDWSAPYDSMLYTDQEMVNFIKTLSPQLASMSPRPKLMVGEYANWGNVWSLASAIASDPVADADTDIYAVHQYSGTSGFWSSSRPLWETETSSFDGFDPGIDNAISVADWVADALSNGNASAWHYWWMRGLNESNEGLVGHASDPFAMTKRVYALGNFSKFVRPGWVRLGTSGSVPGATTLAFQNRSTGEFALVVINHGAPTTSSFGVSGTFQSAITPYQTYDDGSGSFAIGSHGNLEPRAPISATGASVFTATVPHGVTTFVGVASQAQASAPGPFTKTAPTNGSAGLGTSVTLTWSAASGASSYEYCIDTTNDNSCGTWINVGATTSAFVSSLASGTTHYWHVRASNAGGTTYADVTSGAFASFTTQVSAPGWFARTAPANGATGLSTSVTLTWGAASGATSYQYCIDTTNDNACSSWVTAGTATNTVLSSLASATTYYWHVRANNAGGTTYADGNSSAFTSFSTQVNAPGAFNKTAPANGAAGLGTSVTLTWGTASGATSYQYCIDTTNDNACSSWVNAGTATNAVVSSLASATTYYWHVRASNAGGTTYANGGTTAFTSFATLAGLPGSFSKTSPANGATGLTTSVTLTWGAASGATSYQYCIDTTNDNACSSWLNTGTAMSVVVGSLSPATTYYWHVRASNAGGTTYASGSSTAFTSFTTQTSAPGAFSKTAPANGATGVSTSVALTWGAASGATSYQYCIDTTNDNACSSWTSVGSATKASPRLSRRTTYYWHVRATNAGGTTYAGGSAVTFWSFATN